MTDSMTDATKKKCKRLCIDRAGVGKLIIGAELSNVKSRICFHCLKQSFVFCSVFWLRAHQQKSQLKHPIRVWMCLAFSFSSQNALLMFKWCTILYWFESSECIRAIKRFKLIWKLFLINKTVYGFYDNTKQNETKQCNALYFGAWHTACY